MNRLRSPRPRSIAAAWLALLGACAAPLPVPEIPGLPTPQHDPWYRSGRQAAEMALARAASRSPRDVARNVILFVGDGMGVSTVTAARILEGQLRGEPGEENWLAFERLPFVALAKTYNTNQQVSDSAGTMTAIMSGVKTKAGVLGVNDRARLGDHESVADAAVPTLLELAEIRGLATGVVSTARITHATPAACYAHSAHRNWEDDTELPSAAREAGAVDIARQLVELEAGDGIEVALGGGRSRFVPLEESDPEYPELHGRRGDGLNLMEAWRRRGPGARTVWERSELAALGPAIERGEVQQLLGLFEPSHMHWEIDRERDPGSEPSLTEMTEVALRILRRDPDGFFLMVEGGRIDHGHHAGNAYRALTDAIELSNAVRRALELSDPEDTLIVVTADHSHTLSMAGYPTRGNPILGLVVANEKDGTPADSPALDGLGLPYTTLSYSNGPGYPGASDSQPAGAKRFPHRPRDQQPARGRPDLLGVETTAPDFLQESGVPLGAETHAGEDVPIYAGGAGAAIFHGVQEQHFIFHAIQAALGWTQGEPR